MPLAMPTARSSTVSWVNGHMGSLGLRVGSGSKQRGMVLRFVQIGGVGGQDALMYVGGTWSRQIATSSLNSCRRGIQ